ncbi:MAG: hypothetical protein ABSE76_01865 [Minisyncoccia bacterium]|jgi:hypothetical protein
MDPQVQSSFIPKKSLDISTSRSEGSFGLLFLIALLVFIASLVAAGASFLYTGYLNNAIASKAQSLALAEGAFDPGTIQDLVRLDSRLNQSKTLLANHVAVSGVFALLEAQTLANVSFSNFEFDLNSDGTAKITMTGTANSFSTVALQSDQFGGSKLLKDVVFSGITVNTNGSVGFSVTATVDPSVFSYANSLTASNSTNAPSLMVGLPAQAGTSSVPVGSTTPGLPAQAGQ